MENYVRRSIAPYLLRRFFAACSLLVILFTPCIMRRNRSMKRLFTARAWAMVALALLVGALLAPTMIFATTFAQDLAPAADTPTAEPATSTPTSTPQPTSTNTPVPTGTLAPTAVETPVRPTSTPGPSPTPVPSPVPIPEPVTVVLFGTGLAALSAAVATHRNKR
jgi:hypothetical protein